MRHCLLGLVALLCVAAVRPAADPALPGAPAHSPGRGTQGSKPPNVLLITLDDLDFGSLGVTGCPMPNITPNIDRLAAEGMLFLGAHVTSALCQPSRSSFMTGLHPHQIGVYGFGPITADVPTLSEILADHGRINGILAKVRHLQPIKKFQWSFVRFWQDLGAGRDPYLYYKDSLAFLGLAAAENRPFFLMVNLLDPHRPFAGSVEDRAFQRQWKYPDPPQQYTAADVKQADAVPGFLVPGAGPETVREIAFYYRSVSRADQVVGAVLQALEDSGQWENTIVVLLSDHGMSMPFSKSNCYRASTHTPLIVRWPWMIAPGSVDADSTISTVDLMPTLLEACGLPVPAGLAGQSILPVLLGGPPVTGRPVFSSVNLNATGHRFPMRAIHWTDPVADRRHTYIFNDWSDGVTEFRADYTNSATWMEFISSLDPEVIARADFHTHRVLEEFYNYRTDPFARSNVIADPSYLPFLKKLKTAMLQWMEETQDPLLEDFRLKGF